jgi:hypothetical protein
MRLESVVLHQMYFTSQGNGRATYFFPQEIKSDGAFGFSVEDFYGQKLILNGRAFRAVKKNTLYDIPDISSIIKADNPYYKDLIEKVFTIPIEGEWKA